MVASPGPPQTVHGKSPANVIAGQVSERTLALSRQIRSSILDTNRVIVIFLVMLGLVSEYAESLSNLEMFRERTT